MLYYGKIIITVGGDGDMWNENRLMDFLHMKYSPLYKLDQVRGMLCNYINQ